MVQALPGQRLPPETLLAFSPPGWPCPPLWPIPHGHEVTTAPTSRADPAKFGGKDSVLASPKPQQTRPAPSLAPHGPGGMTPQGLPRRSRVDSKGALGRRAVPGSPPTWAGRPRHWLTGGPLTRPPALRCRWRLAAHATQTPQLSASHACSPPTPPPAAPVTVPRGSSASIYYTPSAHPAPGPAPCP